MKGRGGGEDVRCWTGHTGLCVITVVEVARGTERREERRGRKEGRKEEEEGENKRSISLYLEGQESS